MQHDATHIKRLVSELRPASAVPQIFTHDTLDSTNDEAARLLADPAIAAPLVVIARRQTKGRGRLGRPWLSEPNGNLYISFGFRPRVAPPRLQTLTLWAGVTLCDFLAARIMGGREGKGSAAPAIKWPNDIFFGPRKAGGMLAEARAAAGNIDSLVFGLGLNLKPPAAGWPPELAATATSLAEQPGGELADPNAFVAGLIARVLNACDQLLANPAATSVSLAALWQKYDLLRGKTITILSGNERLTGDADGIDSEGSLVLKMTGANTQKIRAGDVTIEKKPNREIPF